MNSDEKREWGLQQDARPVWFNNAPMGLWRLSYLGEDMFEVGADARVWCFCPSRFGLKLREREFKDLDDAKLWCVTIVAEWLEGGKR